MISDICIVVEGSYPFVSGGVASWVHQLISGFPHLSFDILTLQARKTDSCEWKYKKLDNIKNVTRVFLQEGCPKPLVLPIRLPGKDHLKTLIDQGFSIEKFISLVLELNHPKFSTQTILQSFVYSRDLYNLIEYAYEKMGIENKSFIEFFWMIRTLILGYINCILVKAPKTLLIHCVSTGYAGLCGSVQKIICPESKMILTEHGIYTRERKMEIATTVWPDMNQNHHDPKEGQGVYKELWSDSFEFMSRICYQQCDQIFSLFGRNNKMQISEGAEQKKVFTIRNGINLKKFEFCKREKCQEIPKIGFLGRVVKIKDVKTFIRAADIVRKEIGECQFLIAGGYEEDIQYYVDCKALVKMLNLESTVKFLGKVNADEFLRNVDMMVLTSLSEGQPLVMLEASSMGIPLICTDVGGCREIIEGGDGDSLGLCGIVTSQSSPVQTAQAILRMIKNPKFFSKCSDIGRKRMEKIYDEQIFLQEYKKVYANLLGREL